MLSVSSRSSLNEGMPEENDTKRLLKAKVKELQNQMQTIGQLGEKLLQYRESLLKELQNFDEQKNGNHQVARNKLEEIDREFKLIAKETQQIGLEENKVFH